MERTSEIYLSLLERIEVGKGVVDQVCRQPHCGDVVRRRRWGAVELSLLLLLLRCRYLVAVVAGSAFAIRCAKGLWKQVIVC